MMAEQKRYARRLAGQREALELLRCCVRQLESETGVNLVVFRDRLAESDRMRVLGKAELAKYLA